MIMTTNSDKGSLRIQRWLVLLVVGIMAIGYTPGTNAMVRQTSSSVNRRTLSSYRQSIKSPEQNKPNKTLRRRNQRKLAKAKLEERKKDETALLTAYERIFMIAGMNELMYIVKDIAKAERNDAPSVETEAKPNALLQQYKKAFGVPQDFDEFLPNTLTWIVDKVKGDEKINDMMNSIAAKNYADGEYEYQMGPKTAASLFNVFMADTYETTYNAMKEFALNALVEFVVSAEQQLNISADMTMHHVVETLKFYSTPLNDADVPNHHPLLHQAVYERLHSISDKIVTDLKDKQLTIDRNLEVAAVAYADLNTDDHDLHERVMRNLSKKPHLRVLLSNEYKNELYKRVQNSIPLKYRVTIKV